RDSNLLSSHGHDRNMLSSHGHDSNLIDSSGHGNNLIDSSGHYSNMLSSHGHDSNLIDSSGHVIASAAKQTNLNRLWLMIVQVGLLRSFLARNDAKRGSTLTTQCIESQNMIVYHNKSIIRFLMNIIVSIFIYLHNFKIVNL
ncbi:MAG: hypothetical protein IKM95_04910, partial [Bacteroidales bacterium]|nr:hypothetical protein [Bacteroidales bacterium]